MKSIFTFLILAAAAIDTLAQSALDKKTQEILNEGKLLYRIESVNRKAHDLFSQKYKSKEQPAAYITYIDKDEIKTVYYSKAAAHNVVGTITIDTSLNFAGASVTIAERKPTTIENALFEMKQEAQSAVASDPFFTKQDNAEMNIIPVIVDGKKKVYVLTFPKKSGIIMLGNDYVISFNNDNKIADKKKLHNSVITVTDEQKNIGTGSGYTMHTHVLEGDGLIYPTDLCTLMLYKNTGKWRQHYVISRNHVCIWDKDKNELSVLTLQEWEDMLKNPDKAAKMQH